MSAIQKAREALEAAREAMSDSEDFGVFIAVIAKIDAALAALAETPATPADVGEEPVAWGVFRDGKMVAWVPGGGTEFKLPEDTDERRPLYSSTALERVVKERDEAREKIGKLEDDLSEALHEPWPEWASKVLAVIRKRSGYDGYDDAADGVDLPIELDEAMGELEAEADRQKLRAESVEAKLAEALADRAAQAERMARLEEALTKRIEWHTCSCPEPCDDYGVFPGGCAGRYRQDYHSLRALSQEGSEPS